MSARILFVEADDLTITRKRSGHGWRYFDEAGKVIRDREEIERLNSIALPPAYQNARFCPDPRGHLQAYGTDARRRRQYRYNAGYRAGQDAAKFEGCLEFGKALPKLRKRVEADLKGNPFACETVIAAVVKLLDSTHARVGNEAYARENKSFGITTLRNRHATVTAGSICLEYRGKGGIMKSVRLNDRSLTRVVRKVQDLRGQRLFQYRDEGGNIRPVTSGDVNDYIRGAMGADFTAKHFRTWGASAVALAVLAEHAPLKTMLEVVSEALGNTPAIARKSYIHPAIIEDAKAKRYPDGGFPRATQWLSRAERGLIDYLETTAS